ncbi:hypothetical protein HK101_006986, partial [Irineochytrium annulatum]
MTERKKPYMAASPAAEKPLPTCLAEYVPPAVPEEFKAKGGRRLPEEREKRLEARVVRNRIAAQISRDKKQIAMRELEKANCDLATQVSELEKRLAHAEAEKQAIATQMRELAVSVAALQSGAAAPLASLPSLPTPQVHQQEPFTNTSFGAPLDAQSLMHLLSSFAGPSAPASTESSCTTTPPLKFEDFDLFSTPSGSPSTVATGTFFADLDLLDLGTSTSPVVKSETTTPLFDLANNHNHANSQTSVGPGKPAA